MGAVAFGLTVFDQKRNHYSTYNFYGIYTGIGLSSPVCDMQQGPWFDFTPKAGVSDDGFAGMAVFSSAGMSDMGPTNLSVITTASLTKLSISMTTGTSISIGISLAKGTLSLTSSQSGTPADPP
jgi:hypothetical protein